jgi:hypothetical protein
LIAFDHDVEQVEDPLEEVNGDGIGLVAKEVSEGSVHAKVLYEFQRLFVYLAFLLLTTERKLTECEVYLLVNLFAFDAVEDLDEGAV